MGLVLLRSDAPTLVLDLEKSMGDISVPLAQTSVLKGKVSKEAIVAMDDSHMTSKNKLATLHKTHMDRLNNAHAEHVSALNKIHMANMMMGAEGDAQTMALNAEHTVNHSQHLGDLTYAHEDMKRSLGNAHLSRVAQMDRAHELAKKAACGY